MVYILAWAVDSTWNRAGVHGEVCWPYRQHKYTNTTFHGEIELLPLQLTYSHPLHLQHSQSIPHHSRTLMGRTTNWTSHLLFQLLTVMQTEQRRFHGSRRSDIFSISTLCAYGALTQTYFHAGTSNIQRVQGQFWLWIPDSKCLT